LQAVLDELQDDPEILNVPDPEMVLVPESHSVHPEISHTSHLTVAAHGKLFVIVYGKDGWAFNTDDDSVNISTNIKALKLNKDFKFFMKMSFNGFRNKSNERCSISKAYLPV
jgi:hypothetical protein